MNKSNVYKTEFNEEGCIISDLNNFKPELIFDCGQCFRFDSIDDRSFSGIAEGRIITISSISDGKYLLHGVTQEDFPGVADFLALDDDYTEMRQDIISSMIENGLPTETMERAMEVGEGIRILRQDKWEALCSFIISQNNNIPRIKKIINTLCTRYGEKIYDNKNEKIEFSFPSAEALFRAGEEEIFDCRTGFRAKYIFDAARRVASGETDLNEISMMSDSEADGELQKIKGVGPKVSACTLLFGFGRYSAFPVDVWVKRVMAKYYPEGTSPDSFGKYSGLAQQYLFYYERYLSGEG